MQKTEDKHITLVLTEMLAVPIVETSNAVFGETYDTGRYEHELKIIEESWLAYVFRTKTLSVYNRSLAVEAVAVAGGVPRVRLYLSSIRLPPTHLDFNERNLKLAVSWLETGNEKVLSEAEKCVPQTGSDQASIKNADEAR